jgi:hypothetical protein
VQRIGQDQKTSPAAENTETNVAENVTPRPFGGFRSRAFAASAVASPGARNAAEPRPSPAAENTETSVAENVTPRPFGGFRSRAFAASAVASPGGKESEGSATSTTPAKPASFGRFGANSIRMTSEPIVAAPAAQATQPDESESSDSESNTFTLPRGLQSSKTRQLNRPMLSVAVVSGLKTGAKSKKLVTMSSSESESD